MHAVSPQREVTSPGTSRRVLPGWFDPGEPHIARGPFARWPRTTDSVLAVIVFVGSLVAVAASALGDGESFTIAAIGDRPVGAFLMLAGAAGALLWRRRRPIAVAVLVMAIMVAWAFAGYGDGQDLAIVVVAYSVGRYTADHRHSLATVAAVVAVGVLDTVIDANQRVDIAPADPPRCAPLVRGPPDSQPRRLPGPPPGARRAAGGRPARSGPSSRRRRTVPHRP